MKFSGNSIQVCPFQIISSLLYTVYLEQILEGYQRRTRSSTGSDSHCWQWNSKDGVYWQPKKLTNSLQVWGVHLWKQSLRVSSTPLRERKIELGWTPLTVLSTQFMNSSGLPSFCCSLNPMLLVGLLQLIVQLLWLALFHNDSSSGLSQLLMTGLLQFYRTELIFIFFFWEH